MVVHTQGRGHRQRREDAGLREPLDGEVLETTDVRAPVVHRGLCREPVVLQVHLDAFAVAAQQVEKLVVLRERQSVGVDHHPHDRTLYDRLEQGRQLRVQGRLAAAEHQHVQATVLALEPGVDGREDLREGHDARQRGSRRGEARRALEVAVVEEVLEQDAGVLRLHLGEAVRIGRRDGCEVSWAVRAMDLGGCGPLLEVAEDLG